MRKKLFDFWDWIILIGGLAIIVWALLKATGIINTPIWIQMVPYFSGGAVAIGAVFKAGKISQNIDTMGTDVTTLKSRTEDIDKQVIALSKHVCLRDETIHRIDDEMRKFRNPPKR